MNTWSFISENLEVEIMKESISKKEEELSKVKEDLEEKLRDLDSDKERVLKKFIGKKVSTVNDSMTYPQGKTGILVEDDGILGIQKKSNCSGSTIINSVYVEKIEMIQEESKNKIVIFYGP